MGNRKISFFGNLVKMSVGIGNMEKRLIGEKKVQSSEGIERITIYPSNVDLEITASESSDIEIGVYAYIDTNAKVILETKQEKGEYIVTSRINNDNFYGNIILNVAIPSKKKFDQIKVDGKTSDVDFVDFISVNGIDVTTCSGDVTIQKVSAIEGIQVETETGDVEINKNVSTGFLQVKTQKGDIEIENIASKVSTNLKSFSGDVELNYVTSDSISIETESGDIDIHKHVSSKKLKIDTHKGEVETKAKFQNAIINANKGDIEIKTHAMSDIVLDVTTTCGDVEIDFANVGTINLSPKTKSGDIDFSHIDRGGFTAKVNVTTTSGDIEIS